MKKILFSIIALLTMGSFCFAANPLPEVMVGQTTITLENGETLYSGMTGNEAVVNFMESGQRPGKVLGSSLVFDGSNDNVIVPDPEKKFELMGEGRRPTEKTIDLWFKIDSTETDGYLISKPWNSCESYNYGISVSRNQSGKADIHLRLNYLHGNNSKSFTIENVDYNSWNHLMATIDGAGDDGVKDVKMFLNGQKRIDDLHVLTDSDWIPRNDATFFNVDGCATAYSNSSFEYNNNVPLVIGTRYPYYDSNFNSQSVSFKGKIDEVRIYNRVLSEAVAAEHYQGNYADGFTSSLLTQLSFDEGFGLKVGDRSGNEYNGIVANFGMTATSGWSSDGAQAMTEADNNNANLYGFHQGSLKECLGGILIGKTIDRCFSPNIMNTGNVTVMNSRTYINDFPVTEMAAIAYPSKIMVIGDAYLGGRDPNSFAYWGRNLTQSINPSGSENTYWNQKNFSMGSQAQANFGSSEYSSFLAKNKNLLSEAVEVPVESFANQANWYLQNYSSTPFGSNDGSNIYPEGRVWKVVDNNNVLTNLTIDRSVTFYGKGTVIAKNITIQDNISVKPAKTDDVLGAVTYKVTPGSPTEGVCTFGKAISFQAYTFCENKIVISPSGGDFIGSFVTGAFEVSGSQTGMTQFLYTPNQSESVPPGFRVLKMP